jgi:hypothetical protein
LGRKSKKQVPFDYAQGKLSTPLKCASHKMTGQLLIRHGTTALRSFRNNVMQRKPVIPPPAEQAPHRPQSKHLQQPIDRPQLRLLEFQRIALWAFMTNPK